MKAVIVQTHSQGWVHKHQVLAAELVGEQLTLEQVECAFHVSMILSVLDLH